MLRARIRPLLYEMNSARVFVLDGHQVVIDPIDRHCTVDYSAESITSFKPGTEEGFSSKSIEAFVNNRIDSEDLYCSMDMELSSEFPNMGKNKSRQLGHPRGQGGQ